MQQLPCSSTQKAGEQLLKAMKKGQPSESTLPDVPVSEQRPQQHELLCWPSGTSAVAAVGGVS